MPPSRLPHVTSTTPGPMFGLGLAALGRPSYLTIGHGEDVDHHPSRTVMRAQAHTMLDAAWAHGIRYFDAARSYGLAERFLGSWLRERSVAPDELVVGSKWGYRYIANWQPDAEVHEVKEHSRAMLERQRAESAAELGDHLDLYQIHSATTESGVLDNADVLSGLRELAASGLAVGLSTSGAGQATTIHRALEVRRGDGEPLFDTVQATWNVLEPSAGPALADAADAGLAVIVKEAVANGRLTERVPDLARRLEAAASGFPADAVALAAAIQQPWASIVLTGAATTSQLASNMRAREIDVDLRGLEDAMAEAADDYWHYRSTLVWT